MELKQPESLERKQIEKSTGEFKKFMSFGHHNPKKERLGGVVYEQHRKAALCYYADSYTPEKRRRYHTYKSTWLDERFQRSVDGFPKKVLHGLAGALIGQSHLLLDVTNVSEKFVAEDLAQVCFLLLRLMPSCNLTPLLSCNCFLPPHRR